MKKLILVCLVCLLSSNLSFSEVHNVPDDFETIQAAIDASSDEDEIRVSAGRYEEILTIINLDVDIIGNPEDPSSVVIDGAQSGVVITYSGDVDNNTILDGFTITGGEDDQRSAGGIRCNNTSPILRNLIVTENIGARGGGILVEDGNPAIRDVLITNNNSAGYGGGITLMGAASPVMNNLMIRNNESVNRGGGLASFSRGRPELHGSEISNNNSDNNGGGLFSQGNMILVDVTIANNSCEGEGGGLYANGNVTVTGVIISSNSAGGNGGGIYIDGPRPGFERMLIAGNSTQSLGGGIFISGTPNNVSAPTFYHVTFAGNTAEQDGGAFYCHDGANPVVRDCILWGDQPQEVSFNEEEDANSIAITYSDVEGGEDAIETNNNGDVNWSVGAIDADPLFENPEGGDYHLTWVNFPEEDETKSPCIDTGHPDIDPDTDGTRADMGMYFYSQAFPDLEIQPNRLAFGELDVGDSRTLAVVIRNRGEGELVVTMRINPEDSPFRIMREELSFVVRPGAMEETEVTFSPQQRGEYSDELRIESNDVENRLVIVGLHGEGNNRRPQAEEEQAFTMLEDSDLTFLLDLNELFTDPDRDELEFLVSNRQYMSFELRESSRLFVQPEVDYWAEQIEIRVRCDDQFGGIAENIVNLEIEPLNDLPEAFGLITPEDESELVDSLVVFNWEISEQNRWETDEVSYCLFLAIENDGWNYQIEGLEENQSPEIPILAILDENGQDRDLQVEWWVEAHDDSGFVECVERFTLLIPESRPDIAVQPNVISFEEVDVGDTRTLAFTIGNGGDAELRATLSLEPEDAPFAIERENMDILIQPGEEEVVAVSFAPPNRGEFDAEVRIENNDPRDPLVIVTLFGEGANQQPQPEEDRFVILTEDSDMTFLLDLNDMFIDPDGDDLNFTYEDREFLTFELRESSMLFVRPQEDYWTQQIDIPVHCNDQFGGVADNVLHLIIDPLNDLPEPFSLETPENESGLDEDDSLVVFTWQVALQNRWEIDEVSYTIHFDLEWDQWEYQIEDININRSPGIPLITIFDSLDVRGSDHDTMLDWWVETRDDSGFVECRERFLMYIPPSSGVEGDPETPTTFFVYQNYPNPFNAETKISFDLPISGMVSITAFDLAGRPVAVIASGYHLAGTHQINWNAEGLQAGMYIVQVVAGNARGINKVILLK